MQMGEDVWEVGTAVKKFLDESPPKRNEYGVLAVKISDVIAADPVLADYLMQKPDKTLDTIRFYWEEANDEQPINCFNIITYEDMPTTPINEIGGAEAKLVRIKGHIISTTEQKIITSVITICRHEGCRAKGKPIKRPKAPLDCPACRMYYSPEDIINNDKRYMECVFEEVTQEGVEMMTRSILLTVNIPQEVRANILKDDFLKGDKVDICGVVRKKVVETDKEGHKISNNIIEVVGIKFDTTKIFSYEQLKAATEYIERHRGHLLDSISDHIFSGIYKLDWERKAILLSAFGLLDDPKLLNNKSTQTAITIIGDPATAKTTMAYQIMRYFPKADLIGALSTESGIVGGLEKRPDGSWHYLYGKLPRANKGVFIVDEANVIGPEALECVVEAVSHQILRHSKIHQKTQRIFCKYIFLANPPEKVFDEFKPIMKQHNLPITLIDRCDFVVFLQQKLKDEELDNFIKFVDGRKSNPKDCEDDIMRAVIHSLLQNKNPSKISEEAFQTAAHKWKTLKLKEAEIKEKNTEGFKNYSARALTAILKVSCTIARLEGETTVLAPHVEDAYTIYFKACIERLISEYGTLETTDLFPVIREKEPDTDKQLAFWILNEVAETKNGMAIEDIIDKAKSHTKRIKVEQIIEKLKRDGELFEQPAGVLKRM